MNTNKRTNAAVLEDILNLVNDLKYSSVAGGKRQRAFDLMADSTQLKSIEATLHHMSLRIHAETFTQ